MRASFHFKSKEDATDALKTMIGDIEEMGSAQMDFIDEDSATGEPLRLEIVDESNDDFEMPTGSISREL